MNMNMNIKVAISSEFLTAFSRLPRQIQGKVTEFINKFRNNPQAPSINYEKLRDCKDKKLFSVRIDDTYRGIVVRQQETGVYLLLWLDHHDEAYEWARNKRCEVNAKTGAIQVFDVVTVPNINKTEKKDMLFNKTTDNELLELGVPADQLSFVRSITDSSDFYSRKASFSIDVFEALSWLVEGFPAAEVISMLISERTEDQVSDNLVDALKSPETLKSFVVVEGEEELRRIMAEPLEKWRVFLHPTQRKIVTKSYSGSSRVLGGAGTGKTVVAIHRAKYLVSKLKDREKILFTTFTANLASDIKDNLRKICSGEEMKKIEVINLDAWVSRFRREHNYKAEIVYDDDKLDKLWKNAVSNQEFPVSFYRDEWHRVVMDQEALSKEEYIKASRTGRGTRLDRKKRLQVWEVFENYQDQMKENSCLDIDTAMYECRQIISKNASPEGYYKYVIVDEGQDFSANAYRLLRAIVGEHEDDIFIVGDAHQRIYKNKAVLSKCGINIRGRSSLLRINYRTTEEIRKNAFSLLKGISFDDLDGGEDNDIHCQSLTHGELPQRRLFNTPNDEFDAVYNEIMRLKDNGVAIKDICVVARTHKLLDSYIEQFAKKGIRSFEIKHNKPDDRSFDGLRVATMHRVKGIEFQYIFIVSANERVIPYTPSIDVNDSVSKMEALAVEKCLIYVALTRAQKGAYITGFGKGSKLLFGS